MKEPRLPVGLLPLAWEGSVKPSPATVAERLRGEGVDPYRWSNAPGDRYPAHSHTYTKLVMCAAGSITFLVGEAEEAVELHPGEGFVLPAGTRHAANVGPQGCTCLEGHR
jgi:quercetin dioxygenase-like cupin family protein